MQSRSAAFDAAVLTGGRVVQNVYVTRMIGGFAVPVLTALQPLPGSKVSLDRRANIRRTLDLSLADPTGTMMPRTATDALAPYGNEVVVQVGFQYIDGTTELMAAGVFRIEDVDTDEAGNIKLKGRDRGAVIEQALFESPYALTPGQNLGTAITTMLQSRFNGTLPTNFSATAATVPPTATVYLEGTLTGNPWQNAIDLATAVGYELFFDGAGVCVFRPIPSPVALSSVWTYAPGANAMVLNEQDALTSKDVYNVIVVAGEGGPIGASGSAVNPIRSVVAVTDPSSPIYPSSAFGRRPFAIQDSTITTQAQADSTAAALLLRYAGSGEAITFGAAPNPAHEPGDVVRLQEPDLLKLDVYVVLDAWDLDLGLRSESKYATTGRRST